MSEEPEQTLMLANECFVYKIPPRTTADGYKLVKGGFLPLFFASFRPRVPLTYVEHKIGECRTFCGLESWRWLPKAMTVLSFFLIKTMVRSFCLHWFGVIIEFCYPSGEVINVVCLTLSFFEQRRILIIPFSGSEFARAPIPNDPHSGGLEPVVDSSRYFVIRIDDGHGLLGWMWQYYRWGWAFEVLLRVYSLWHHHNILYRYQLYYSESINIAPGKHAFIGMGFNDRSLAFDFNMAIQDHRK